jgi:hypothetical protein
MASGAVLDDSEDNGSWGEPSPIPTPDTVKKGSNTVVKTTATVVKGSSGTEETIAVTAQYPDGYPSVVSVETRKTEGQHRGIRSIFETEFQHEAGAGLVVTPVHCITLVAAVV